MLNIIAIFLWIQANNPTPPPAPQPPPSWMQDNILWLQMVIGILQALFAGVAIWAALRAADKNARIAFELSEERKRNEHKAQIDLVRFSLNLEIQQNLQALNRLNNNLSEFTRFEDEESSEESEEAQDVNDTLSQKLNVRQRFIALHMTDLSYRFWHSQQLSSLLLVALNEQQISHVNLIYSQFDRLSKISNMFWHMATGTTLQLSTGELNDLLAQFNTVLRDVLDMSNPLADLISKNTK